MNGDFKTIYEAITNLNEKNTSVKVDVAQIKTSQKLNHEQNQKDIREYHKTADGFIKLKTAVFYQWFFIGAVFISIITILLKGI